MNKYDEALDVITSLRDEYYDKATQLLEGMVGNGDITEEQASEIRNSVL